MRFPFFVSVAWILCRYGKAGQKKAVKVDLDREGAGTVTYEVRALMSALGR